ncbi:MAG: hypothetical protein ACRYGF_15410 [Janthinobacterium lividum]
MALFCSAQNPAQRRYQRGAFGVALSYIGFFFSSEFSVHRFHPSGWHLYLAALLPTFSIVGLLFIVGRYLREETDEFVRDQFIRSVLWSIAAVMAYTMFFSFLRTFGWQGTTKPFAEYYVFCITLLIAKFSYKLRDRVVNDE